VITELRVRDLATIADVTLPLGPGLNVLTGETGAGKSMLVDALGLLLGGRGDSGVIRPGAARAVVEGVVEEPPRTLAARLETLGLDPDADPLVVRREVSAEGRSRAWVSGSPTTVTALEQLGALLVDLHDQHQTASLLRLPTQRELLDGFAHAEGEVRAVEQTWREVERLRAEEAELVRRRDEVRRKADYLRHVVQEIEVARLVPGEDETLERDRRRLGQAEQLRALARRIAVAVDGDEGGGGALPALAEAERALGQLERVEASVAEWRGLVDQGYAALEELARQARAYGEGLEDEPARLAQLEARRDLLDRLRRKHGDTVEAVLRTRDESARELELLDTADLDLRTLAAQIAAAERARAAAAGGLSARRREGAARLARQVSRLLPQLGLAGGRLEVELAPLPEPGPHGEESVQFLARLNLGLDARPLGRSASGGELSRLMLALKVALARQDRTPTLVFDEVDQGIGGEVGAQVGAALAEVAERHQVLVVTHLPQIAARADRHLVVSKRARGGIATSQVELIHGEDRVGELARMLGDAESEAARRHAAAMLGGTVRR